MTLAFLLEKTELIVGYPQDIQDYPQLIHRVKRLCGTETAP